MKITISEIYLGDINFGFNTLYYLKIGVLYIERFKKQNMNLVIDIISMNKENYLMRLIE
jgi:hypothetical protein